MRRWLRWVVPVALAGVVGISLSGRRGRTVRTSAGPIGNAIAALAVVEPRGGTVVVRASSPGRIVEVDADIGDRVRRGTVLCRLETLEAKLEEVSSPVEGTVVSLEARVGDHLGVAGAPILTVANLDRLVARLEIPDRDAVHAEIGQRVELRKRGGGATLFRQRLERLAPSLVEPTIGLADARARASGRVRIGWVAVPGDAPVLSGERIEARIELPPYSAPVRAPRGAVRIEDGRATVRVPWGPFWREQAVGLGPADSRFVTVRGIPAGTQVVVDDL